MTRRFYKNSVADRMVERGCNLTGAEEASAKASYRLEHATAQAVIGRIQLEQVEDSRCDPAGASLVSRKLRSVQHPVVQTGPRQAPSTRRTCRPTADDQDITAIHARLERKAVLNGRS